MKPSDFIHPEDAAALRQMEGIPGFAALVKKILAIGIENLQYGVNMASTIRLSELQLPKIYRHLPPICRRLGISEPEFYLQMDPNPNAWTMGDTRIYIVVTSGLLEMMSDEELMPSSPMSADISCADTCSTTPWRNGLVADWLIWESWERWPLPFSMRCSIGTARVNCLLTVLQVSSLHLRW